LTGFLAHNPMATFALVLGLSVLVPPLLHRLRLPDLVGLLLAGVLVGPHGLDWLSSKSETIRLLSDVGVIYLLFIAGLEIDLVEFARIRQRSFRFGLLTFCLPMAGGTLLGLGFGYSLLGSVLLGSILSSHTPLGYPIVRSYGAMREESVVVAIGGTIFTDIAALVLLALTVGLARGGLGPLGALLLLLKVATYAALVLVLIQRLGRVLVRRNVNNDSQLFVLVLLAVFLAALAAELAGVEKIVGAFLAGLAVNGVLPEGRVKEQVIFVGASLFIPIFFIDLGLLLNLPAFLATLQGSLFAAALIVTLVGAKGLASWWAGRLYRYNGAQMLTLWSLSLPQVAATLAATFVGFRAGLLDEQVLNSVLALMVVTATLGPTLTALAMPRLGRAGAMGLEALGSGSLALARRSLSVLVPVANPENERSLLSLAQLLIDGDGDQPGRVLPLAVVSPYEPEAGGASAAALTARLGQGRQLLQQAQQISAEQGIPCHTLLRVDSDVAAGIARVAVEQGSDLVLMGVTAPSRLGRWLFGDLVDATCRQVPCPVVVARLLSEPRQWQRLLVPVKDLTAGALEQFQLAERLAAALGAGITLLHLHDPRLSGPARAQLRRDLERWRPGSATLDDRPGSGNDPVNALPVNVELHPNHGVETAILRQASRHDLVILRSQRRLVAGLPIPASDLTNRLVQRLGGSTLVISDPLH
jgi:Kef-type K+ transport system membrane component KefB/nucleotide-binding universal stress UspA family protein